MSLTWLLRLCIEINWLTSITVCRPVYSGWDFVLIIAVLIRVWRSPDLWRAGVMRAWVMHFYERLLLLDRATRWAHAIKRRRTHLPSLGPNRVTRTNWWLRLVIWNSRFSSRRLNVLDENLFYPSHLHRDAISSQVPYQVFFRCKYICRLITETNQQFIITQNCREKSKRSCFFFHRLLFIFVFTLMSLFLPGVRRIA